MRAPSELYPGRFGQMKSGRLLLTTSGRLRLSARLIARTVAELRHGSLAFHPGSKNVAGYLIAESALRPHGVLMATRAGLLSMTC